MVNREAIRNIILGYLPEADDIRVEWLVNYTAKAVELQIYQVVREAILSDC